MRVLVTGASGFIGAKLCEALLARGDEVVGLTRDPERAHGGDPRIAWHAWQPSLERPSADALEGIEGVVHLVGERIDQRWSEAAKRRIMESRRTGTQNLVHAIAAMGSRPAAMVSQSAIGFYGDRGDAVLDESAAPGTGFDAEVVREWERAAQAVEACGVRLVLTRTGHVLDPRGGFLGRLMTPFRLGVGGPVAGGRQYLSWIHIDDEVGLLLWALDGERVGGAINATAPEPATSRDFASALGRALGRPAILPLPGLALDLMFGREFGRILRGGQRVVPRRAQELGYRFAHPELEGALDDLLSR